MKSRKFFFGVVAVLILVGLFFFFFGTTPQFFASVVGVENVANVGSGVVPVSVEGLVRDVEHVSVVTGVVGDVRQVAEVV